MKYVFAWVLLFLLLSGCAAESMMPERKYTLNQTAPETEEEWARHSAASDEVQRILPYVRGGKSLLHCLLEHVRTHYWFALEIEGIFINLRTYFLFANLHSKKELFYISSLLSPQGL